MVTAHTDGRAQKPKVFLVDEADTPRIEPTQVRSLIAIRSDEHSKRRRKERAAQQQKPFFPQSSRIDAFFPFKLDAKALAQVCAIVRDLFVRPGKWFGNFLKQSGEATDLLQTVLHQSCPPNVERQDRHLACLGGEFSHDASMKRAQVGSHRGFRFVHLPNRDRDMNFLLRLRARFSERDAVARTIWRWFSKSRRRCLIPRLSKNGYWQNLNSGLFSLATTTHRNSQSHGGADIRVNRNSTDCSRSFSEDDSHLRKSSIHSSSPSASIAVT